MSQKKSSFNARKEIDKICSFIQNYFKKNNIKGVVLGISGGKDSAVVAGLFTKAIGKDNVVGLTLPCESKKEDAQDAKLLSEYLGFKLYNIDLTETYRSLLKQVNKLHLPNNNDETLDSNINLKPRLRMSTCYYMAAYLSKIEQGTYIVAGTSNACELYVGYFTKGGDSVHDISVLANLTVEEVIAIGDELKLPKKLVHKTPSDGLSGKSDEEKMGIKYKDVTSIIRKKKVSKEAKEKIEVLHKRSQHKFHIPTYRR